MVVGPVEAATGEGLRQPCEQSAVSDVHPQGDLGLPSVTAERALPHQDPDQDPDIEGFEGRHCFTVGCHVKQASCFTVGCHVKQAAP